ncbi:MAG TPA: NUMOD1 domain-containing DNA-binding protein [Patescibacteria group bacterium]|nr:NUMOD1 domain-containing DNA-binding protein [Patescibacteria group bacterium]
MVRRKRIVNQLTLEGKLISTFGSIKEAAELTGVHRTGIWRCLSGRGKRGGNFHWEYADEGDQLGPLFPIKDDDERNFFCQGCGQKTGPRRKFLVCGECIQKLIRIKTGQRPSEIVFILVDKGALTEIMKKELRAFTRKK